MRNTQFTFRDGPTGRRAGLIGGPDVWEVAMWLEDLAAEPDPLLPCSKSLTSIGPRSRPRCAIGRPTRTRSRLVLSCTVAIRRPPRYVEAAAG